GLRLLAELAELAIAPATLEGEGRVINLVDRFQAAPPGSPDRYAPNRPSTVPTKVSLSRSHQLLELASKVVKASHGDIGLIAADGSLVEHIPWGISDQAAADLWRGSRLTELVRFVLRQPAPVCLDSLAAAQPDLGGPAEGQRIGPFLGLPLNCPGRYRG